jgi:hypothetical protein
MPHLCEVTARYMVRGMNIDSLWPVLQLADEILESVLKDESAKVMDHVCMHAFMYNITENTGNKICASKATSKITWCHNTGNRI